MATMVLAQIGNQLRSFPSPEAPDAPPDCPLTVLLAAELVPVAVAVATTLLLLALLPRPVDLKLLGIVVGVVWRARLLAPISWVKALVAV